jgi:hypothetical protein
MSTLGIKGILVNCTHGSRAFCKSCVVAKFIVANINRESTRSDDLDTCFHTLAIDIWGRVSTPSIGNSSYIFGVVCYKSAFIMAELIKTKSDSVTVFRSFLRKIRLFDYRVHVIRINNDSIFLGADFQAVCQEFDIVAQRSVPYRHHQLGRMEREWRTLSDTTMSMLDDSMLGKTLWENAFLTAIYVRKRVWSQGSAFHIRLHLENFLIYPIFECLVVKFSLKSTK